MPDIAQTEPKPKHAGGRPTDYKPTYCAWVIDWGRQGKSKTWMAATLEISRKTFNNWERDNPEFLLATERAMALSQLWWEDKAQDGLAAGILNSGLWRSNVAARFPADWAVKQEITGVVTGKIEHEHKYVVDPRLLGDDQRDILRQAILAAQTPLIQGEIVDDDA